MGLMQLARLPTASFCHFANTGNKKSEAQKKRETRESRLGGCRGEEGEVGSEGLRKGEGIEKRELVKAEKREKGQDIGGVKKGGEF